ncbi:Prolyl 4-hydroxylase subunit alpha-1 [Nymphon striatum]|nr:Prolyl 4-hydroxylase subunit alpha-1 [Nymphon striatum]
MIVKLVIFSLVLISNAPRTNCQDTTKIVTDRTFLKKILSFEPTVVEALNEYLKNEEERFKVIKKYIDNYENRLEPHLEDVDDFLDHPLNTYEAIRHLSREWTDLQEIIAYQSYASEGMLLNLLLDYLLANINNIRENFEHSRFDLYNAGTSIHRLQLTYNLSIEALADGNIVAEETNDYSGLKPAKSPLTATEEGFLPEAGKWADSAEAKIKAGDTSSADEYVQAQRELIEEKKNDIRSFRLYPSVNGKTTTCMKCRYYRSHENSDLTYYLYKNDQIDADVENEMFRRLCRNKTLRFPSWDSKLKCKLETRNNSYLLLQPIKLEIASEYPRIEIMHKIFTDKQIEKILARAKQEELVSSEVNDEVQGIDGVDTTSRSSAHVWLSDNIGKDITQITDIIEVATGLSASDVKFNGEPYQVANYATGGRYQPHPDHLGEDERIHPSFNEEINATHICGDRIATFMIYLNEVGEGGSTVFPDIGASVVPEKGSAVFWWNMNKAGVGDDYTRHGGCPVLYGSKWIMNKWFCFRPQIFKKPCGLNEHDYHIESK